MVLGLNYSANRNGYVCKNVGDGCLRPNTGHSLVCNEKTLAFIIIIYVRATGHRLGLVFRET